jgi:MSHA biogenesis protein MshP
MHLKSQRPKSRRQRARGQEGFALVAAMFVMIIIAMVVLAMMRLAGNQHGTNSLAIQQARAYQAARAGLDWGIAQAAPPVGAPSCAGNALVSLAGSNLSEFTVAVTCSPSAYSESGVTVNVYRLTATAQNGLPGSRSDYAFRALNAAVQSAVP